MKSACFVKSDIGFFFGDPCHVLSNELYYDYYCGVCRGRDGRIEDPETGLAFGVAATYAGDCVFMDSNGNNEFVVDSGSLALIPLELVKPEKLRPLCNFIRRVPGTAAFLADNGYFRVLFPDEELFEVFAGRDIVDEFEPDLYSRDIVNGLE